jgi:hypothetical protein
MARKKISDSDGAAMTEGLEVAHGHLGYRSPHPDTPGPDAPPEPMASDRAAAPLAMPRPSFRYRAENE